jgi:hypothetical protein
MHFLAAGEVERLAEAIGPPYGLLVRFAAHTGLRAGELVALRVKRLDLLRGAVRVVESASEVGGRLIFGSTKTYADRTVRLPRFLATSWPCISPGSPATLTGSCSPPPRAQFHQVTMDRYGHLFPDALEQLADRLDAAHSAARTDPARTEPPAGVVELPARQATRRA